jgi:hypothetical protein
MIDASVKHVEPAHPFAVLQGCMRCEVIPIMPTSLPLPLIERFAAKLAEIPVLPILGAV